MSVLSDPYGTFMESKSHSGDGAELPGKAAMVGASALPDQGVVLRAGRFLFLLLVLRLRSGARRAFSRSPPQDRGLFSTATGNSRKTSAQCSGEDGLTYIPVPNSKPATLFTRGTMERYQ